MQPQVSLVDQLRRLERMPGALRRPFGPATRAELIVDLSEENAVAGLRAAGIRRLFQVGHAPQYTAQHRLIRACGPCARVRRP